MNSPLLLEEDTPLADVALSHPWSWSILRSHGFHVCCRGRVTMKEACEGHSVSVAQLRQEIKEAETVPPDLVFWDQRPVEELVEHILDRFHARHREDLPGIIELAQECEIAHASGPAWPTGLVQHLERMSAELELHMRKEEEVLFPLIQRGLGRHAVMPIAVMQAEHEEHDANLRRLRELTLEFHAPDHACASWVDLYSRLIQLEDDLMMHMHLENNVLFPRVLKG